MFRICNEYDLILQLYILVIDGLGEATLMHIYSMTEFSGYIGVVILWAFSHRNNIGLRCGLVIWIGIEFAVAGRGFNTWVMTQGNNNSAKWEYRAYLFSRNKSTISETFAHCNVPPITQDSVNQHRGLRCGEWIFRTSSPKYYKWINFRRGWYLKIKNPTWKKA